MPVHETSFTDVAEDQNLDNVPSWTNGLPVAGSIATINNAGIAAPTSGTLVAKRVIITPGSNFNIGQAINIDGVDEIEVGGKVFYNKIPTAMRRKLANYHGAKLNP